MRGTRLEQALVGSFAAVCGVTGVTALSLHNVHVVFLCPCQRQQWSYIARNHKDSNAPSTLVNRERNDLRSRRKLLKDRDGSRKQSGNQFHVPQGFVFGPLLFVMYTTLLSIPSFPLVYLTTTSTQMTLCFFFPSFRLTQTPTQITFTIDRISSWMTANLLTLNSSKTEFLLIGLRKQIAKINNSSLTTTHSARNLGFIFDEHLTFFDQISSVSKSCYYHIRQLRCIRPYLDTKTASTIATFIVHSKLDYATLFITTCLSLRSPGSNRSRTLLHLLLSKLPNPVASLLSSGLYTG